MKFIIVGSEGFIATRLIGYLKTKGYPLLLTSENSQEQKVLLNLKSPEIFDYQIIHPGDFIIQLAAISSPDYCNSHYDAAYQINVTGTKYFIKNALLRGARVLFLSSDVVYGASATANDTYNEKSFCNPLGNYAQMKFNVETEFVDHTLFKVFRLSYVFAKNDKYTNYLLECVKRKKSAEVYSSLYRNVIYIQDIIQAIECLNINWDKFDNKVFNLCGRDLLSRENIAEYFKKFIHHNLDYKVLNPPEIFFVNRPPIISTTSLYLSNLLQREQTYFKDALKIEFSE